MTSPRPRRNRLEEQAIGIQTIDFRLLHDLIAALKERGLAFQVLTPGQGVPEGVGVVITSTEELPRVKFRNRIAAKGAEDAIGEALRLLRGKDEFRDLIIGVDPGPRPGLAIVGDGEVVEVRTAPSPEAVGELVGSLLKLHPAKAVTVRVGHGDPTNRNRIINSLAGLRLEVEITDEKGTTRDTRRDDRRNMEAAVGIAFTSGVRAERWYRLVPTEGELREIQRLSRIGSAGEVTISRDLASRVAKGKLTMEEAIRHQKGKEGRGR